MFDTKDINNEISNIERSSRMQQQDPIDYNLLSFL